MESSRVFPRGRAIEGQAEERRRPEVGPLKALVLEEEVERRVPELRDVRPPLHVQVGSDHIGVVPDEIVAERFPVGDEGRGQHGSPEQKHEPEGHLRRGLAPGRTSLRFLGFLTGRHARTLGIA